MKKCYSTALKMGLSWKQCLESISWVKINILRSDAEGADTTTSVIETN